MAAPKVACPEVYAGNGGVKFVPPMSLSRGAPSGVLPDWSLSYMLTVMYHSILPALSIVLAATGFWALGMRGMMVTTQGEDACADLDPPAKLVGIFDYWGHSPVI